METVAAVEFSNIQAKQHNVTIQHVVFQMCCCQVWDESKNNLEISQREGLFEKFLLRGLRFLILSIQRFFEPRLVSHVASAQGFRLARLSL